MGVFCLPVKLTFLFFFFQNDVARTKQIYCFFLKTICKQNAQFRDEFDWLDWCDFVWTSKLDRQGEFDERLAKVAVIGWSCHVKKSPEETEVWIGLKVKARYWHGQRYLGLWQKWICLVFFLPWEIFGSQPFLNLRCCERELLRQQLCLWRQSWSKSKVPVQEKTPKAAHTVLIGHHLLYSAGNSLFYG